jgi:ABC-type sugar transport system substrate-binding protein
VALADGMYNRETAAALAREMFGRPDRPDAVFVGNDHMAFAVMDTLRFELGLPVPHDVSVVGYDDVPIAAWPAYDLTTIRQPVNRMVEATVDALLSRIEGDTAPRRILIPGPLILRGSARKPEGIHAMKGFDPKFADFPDYIIGITKEIWEDRGIATLHRYYAPTSSSAPPPRSSRATKASSPPRWRRSPNSPTASFWART